MNTRRQFLGLAACSAAGALVSPRLKTVLAADGGPSMRFPMAARERIAIASYPFREFIVGRDEKAGAAAGRWS